MTRNVYGAKWGSYKIIHVVCNGRARYSEDAFCTVELQSCTELTIAGLFLPSVLQDLEWKIIYVGSASSEAHDQTLDSVLVGPVPVGKHKFVFQVSPLSLASQLRGYSHAFVLPCIYVASDALVALGMCNSH